MPKTLDIPPFALHLSIISKTFRFDLILQHLKLEDIL